MPSKYASMEERLLDFADLVCNLVEALPPGRLSSRIVSQLLDAGTSVPPHYAEAQDAKSRRDFIHKMKVCLKELRETRVWVKMAYRRKLAQGDKVTPLLKECDELIAIFVTSVKTARKNLYKEETIAAA